MSCEAVVTEKDVSLPLEGVTDTREESTEREVFNLVELTTITGDLTLPVNKNA